jgi:hypothetical protein
MGIEDIKKELFKNKEESNESEGEKEPIFFRGEDFKPKESNQSWIREIKKNSPTIDQGTGARSSFLEKFYQWIIRYQKRIYAILGVMAGVVLLGFLAIFFIGSASFAKKDVLISIEGPPHGDSGSEVNYKVAYQNKTKTILHDAKILITFPKMSLVENTSIEYGPYVQFQNVGDILPDAKGSFEFRARIFGAKDQKLNIVAKIRYHPEGITSEFENEDDIDFFIDSVPLAVNFNLPQRAVIGQPYVFNIDYTNQSDAEFKDMWFSVLYPVGFNFQIASPTPSEGESSWKISSIAPHSSGSISISGILSGVSGEAKSFQVKIGPKDEFNQIVEYVNSQSSTPISQSLLVVSQKINNGLPSNVSAGDFLNWNIHYKNTTNIGLNNVQIVTQFRGDILDFSKLKLNQGHFDSQNNRIIWNASDVPQLALLGPFAEGDLFFSVNIKDPPPVFSSDDKDLMENISVSITSASVPNTGELGSVPIGNVDSLDLKLNSKIIFVSKGLYFSGPFTNSGPIPLKVGQKTTFTIVWQITNWSSDISDVKVKAGLPSTAEWLGEVYPAEAPLSYDFSSGQITWLPGLVNAGTGVVSPIKEVAFRVGITPSINQLHQAVVLLNQALFSAQDSFTGRTYQTLSESVNTALKFDSRFPGGGGYVSQ